MQKKHVLALVLFFYLSVNHPYFLIPQEILPNQQIEEILAEINNGTLSPYASLNTLKPYLNEKKNLNNILKQLISLIQKSDYQPEELENITLFVNTLLENSNDNWLDPALIADLQYVIQFVNIKDTVTRTNASNQQAYKNKDYATLFANYEQAYLTIKNQHRLVSESYQKTHPKNFLNKNIFAQVENILDQVTRETNSYFAIYRRLTTQPNNLLDISQDLDIETINNSILSLNQLFKNNKQLYTKEIQFKKLEEDVANDAKKMKRSIAQEYRLSAFRRLTFIENDSLALWNIQAEFNLIVLQNLSQWLLKTTQNTQALYFQSINQNLDYTQVQEINRNYQEKIDLLNNTASLWKFFFSTPLYSSLYTSRDEQSWQQITLAAKQIDIYNNFTEFYMSINSGFTNIIVPNQMRQEMARLLDVEKDLHQFKNKLNTEAIQSNPINLAIYDTLQQLITLKMQQSYSESTQLFTLYFNNTLSQIEQDFISSNQAVANLNKQKIIDDYFSGVSSELNPSHDLDVVKSNLLDFLQRIQSLESDLDRFANALIIDHNKDKLIEGFQLKINSLQEAIEQKRKNYQESLALITEIKKNINRKFNSIENLIQESDYNRALNQIVELRTIIALTYLDKNQDKDLSNWLTIKIPRLSQELNQARNNSAINDVRLLINSTKSLFQEGRFIASNRQILQALALWQTIFVQENVEITYWLRLTSQALDAERGLRFDPYTADYNEMQQHYNYAYTYYNAGKNNNESTTFNKSLQEINFILSSYPNNIKTLALQMRILSLYDPNLFQKTYNEQYNKIKKNINSSDFSDQKEVYTLLSIWEQVYPNNREIKRWSYEIKLKLKLIEPIIEKSNREEAQILFEDARRLYNRNPTVNRKRILQLLNRALTIDSSLVQASRLIDTMTQIVDTKEDSFILGLSPSDQALFNEAERKYVQKRFLEAQIITNSLLENVRYQEYAPLVELASKINARL